MSGSNISRRLDKAEAIIVPKPRARLLLIEAGDDVPRDQIEAFERDVLSARAGDLVVMIRDFIDRLSPPRYLSATEMRWWIYGGKSTRALRQCGNPPGWAILGAHPS